MPPSGERRAYFDHAATAPLHPAARQAWLDAVELVGNPTGLHLSARRAKAMLEDARESIAADLGAHPSEVILTASASQSDSLAVLGGRTLRPDRPIVALSAVEHPGVATVAARVDDVRLLPVDASARVMLEAAADIIDASVALVSVQRVNGEVGTIQPLTEVIELAHRAGALAHSDCVQGMVWPGVSFAELDLDLASVAGHKVGAPVGIGALLVRRGLVLPAAGLGAGQEGGIVSGTPAVALASAFAAALCATLSSREADRLRLEQIRGRIVQALEALPGVRVNGPSAPEGRVPGIVHATITGARADDVLLLLDREGIDASTGASCRAGMHQPSDVVLAMTGSLADASSSIRLSFGPEVGHADVDRLVAVLPSVTERARLAGGP